MSITDAAKALRITRKTLYRWIEEGRLEVERYPYKRHGRIRVPEREVGRLLADG